MTAQPCGRLPGRGPGRAVCWRRPPGWGWAGAHPEHRIQVQLRGGPGAGLGCAGALTCPTRWPKPPRAPSACGCVTCHAIRTRSLTLEYTSHCLPGKLPAKSCCHTQAFSTSTCAPHSPMQHCERAHKWRCREQQQESSTARWRRHAWWRRLRRWQRGGPLTRRWQPPRSGRPARPR